MADAFKQRGFGFGYTWRNDLTYFSTKWSLGVSFKLIQRKVDGTHSSPFFDDDGNILVGKAKVGESLFFSRVYTANISFPF